MEKGADPNAVSQFGWTALMQAATRGHLLACGYLVARGAEVNLATLDGWTALHKAANNGHTQIVKLLLEKGRTAMRATRTGGQRLIWRSRPGITRLWIYSTGNSMRCSPGRLAQHPGDAAEGAEKDEQVQPRP